MARTKRQSPVECIQGFLNNCGKYPDDIPDEQLEYFLFQPLLVPVDQIHAGSDTASEYEEDVGGTGATGVAAPIEIPKQSVLELLFEKEASGGKILNSEQTANLARRLGFSPSAEDNEQLRQKKGEEVDFKAFNDWLETVQHDEDTPDFIKAIFEHVDSDKSGKITMRQLQHILTTLGGPNALTDAEFKRFIAAKNVREDPLNYNQLIHITLERPAPPTEDDI